MQASLIEQEAVNHAWVDDECVIRMGAIDSEADFFSAIYQLQRIHSGIHAYSRWVLDLTDLPMMPLALRSLLCALCEDIRHHGRELVLLGVRPEHNLNNLCPECVNER